MNKEEFIAQFDVPTRYKTEFGLNINGRKRFALTCGCGDDLCKGWAMVYEDDVKDHLLRYPKAI